MEGGKFFFREASPPLDPPSIRLHTHHGEASTPFPPSPGNEVLTHPKHPFSLFGVSRGAEPLWNACLREAAPAKAGVSSLGFNIFVSD